MKKNRLQEMVKGWFIGDFEPSVLKSTDVEVAVKIYNKGEKEVRHHHRISTEVTVITNGKVKMNGEIFKTGDIITISPFESTDFEALENSQTTVVKIPAAIDDKYLGEYKSD